MPKSSQSDPFPHGEVVGGYYDYESDTGLVRLNWDCLFLLDAGLWHAVLLKEDNTYSEIRSSAETPRDAFEKLVTNWTIRNGGVVSPFMQYILPTVRAELDAHGLTEDA